jgi:hypothetical protein
VKTYYIAYKTPSFSRDHEKGFKTFISLKAARDHHKYLSKCAFIFELSPILAMAAQKNKPKLQKRVYTKRDPFYWTKSEPVVPVTVDVNARVIAATGLTIPQLLAKYRPPQIVV